MHSHKASVECKKGQVAKVGEDSDASPTTGVLMPQEERVAPGNPEPGRCFRAADRVGKYIGSGKYGRIEQEDIERHFASRKSVKEDIVVELGRTRNGMWKAMEKCSEIPHPFQGNRPLFGSSITPERVSSGNRPTLTVRLSVVSDVGTVGAGERAMPVLVHGGGVAIVAIGRVRWVWDVDRGEGKGERRLKLGISSSTDHRVVEAAELAAFVETWQGWLELCHGEYVKEEGNRSEKTETTHGSRCPTALNQGGSGLGGNGRSGLREEDELCQLASSLLRGKDGGIRMSATKPWRERSWRPLENKARLRWDKRPRTKGGGSDVKDLPAPFTILLHSHGIDVSSYNTLKDRVKVTGQGNKLQDVGKPNTQKPWLSFDNPPRAAARPDTHSAPTLYRTGEGEDLLPTADRILGHK
ncbi:hypothetical protein BGW80DRAFT_1255205 [Lactifluus volemus]|nr:hypothetical protein BGW80DRAFT_1255205 [Lactifluus volemus]